MSKKKTTVKDRMMRPSANDGSTESRPTVRSACPDCLARGYVADKDPHRDRDNTVSCKRCKGTGYLTALILLLLMLGVAATTPYLEAAMVTGTIRNRQGAPVSTNILFKAIQRPLFDSVPSVLPGWTVTTNSAADGTFSTPLLAGDYQVTVMSEARDSFIIAVPTNNATYDIQLLVTNLATYTYTGGQTFTNFLASLNGATGANQSLTNGTNGADFAINTAGNVHTFNLPPASASKTGKLSATDFADFASRVTQAQMTAGSNSVIAFAMTVSNAVYTAETTRNAAVSNANVAFTVTTSNSLYTTETTRNAAVSNANVAFTMTASNMLYALETARHAVVSNAVVAFAMTMSNTLYSTETTRNAAVSNALVAFSMSMSNTISLALSNNVRVVSGTGGITVTASGSAGVMTYTVSDDDAGGGGGTTDYNRDAGLTNSTRVGLDAGRVSNTNLIRTLQFGWGGVLTNQGTNVVLAVDQSVVPSHTQLVQASNDLYGIETTRNAAVSNGVMGEVMTSSNNLYSTETTRNAAVSNALVSFALAMSNALYTLETTRNAAVSNGVMSEVMTSSNNLYSTETTRNAAVSNALVSFAMSMSNVISIALSNNVRVVAGTGGITVTPSGSAGVMTYTVDDDDAGSGGSTPGGNSGAVQFNQGGTMAGTNVFVWDRTNNVLRLFGGATSARLHIIDTANGYNTAFFPGGIVSSNTQFFIGATTHTGSNVWSISITDGSFSPVLTKRHDFGQFSLRPRTNYGERFVASDSITIDNDSQASDTVRKTNAVASTNVFWQSIVAPAANQVEMYHSVTAAGAINHTVKTNRTLTVAGTANEIDVANGTFSPSTTPTFSLSSTIDLGGKTSFEIPNSAAPSTTVFGQLAGDNDFWGASRGVVQTFDGTEAVVFVQTLKSDAPANGQVPTWNTGGTATWETPIAYTNQPTATYGSLVLTNSQQSWMIPLFLRTTNMWADGGAAPVYTNRFSANAGGLTNILATNLLNGSYVDIWVFPSNGVTVGLPQFTAAQYTGGVIKPIRTNQWSLIRISRRDSDTNVTVFTRDYVTINGSNITTTTNDATGEITVNANAGGTNPVAFASGSLYVSNSVQLQAGALLQRTTNLWFDGGMATRWTNRLTANIGGLTNLLGTNILDGQEIELWIFPETGVTAGFPQFTASQYSDGAVVRLSTNQWNRVQITRRGSDTNLVVNSRTYSLVNGNGITTSTNDVTGEITINAASTNQPVMAAGWLTLTNQILYVPQEFNGSNGVTAATLTANWDMRLNTFKAVTNRVGTNLVFNLSNVVQTASLVTVLQGVGGYSNTVSFLVPGGGTNIVWANWSTNGNYDIQIRPNFTYTVQMFADRQSNIVAWVSTDDIYVPVSSIWHYAVNSGISNLIATNAAVRAGASSSNAAVGGTLWYSVTAVANPTSNGTAAAMVTIPIRAHTMTNTGDRVAFKFAGTMPAAQANTNQFVLVVNNGGPNVTLLDSGMQTASNTVYEITLGMTRTGPTSHFIDTRLEWGPGGGVPFMITNSQFYTTTTTNGLDLSVILRSTARRQGSHTNLMSRVWFDPAPR